MLKVMFQRLFMKGQGIGVETVPGKKDFEKVKEFVEKARE